MNIRVSLGACALLPLLLLGACAGPGTTPSSMPALAQMVNVPLRLPGDLANTAMTLGVLPANLLPRMNKGGTVEPVPGIKVTAVRAEHSSIYVWRNPTTQKDETHPGGEAVGWIIELENGFRIYHAPDGVIYGARPLAEPGDTNTEYKPGGHALVMVMGNFEVQQPSPAQLASMAELMAWIAQAQGLTAAEIATHKDFSKQPLCPGKNLEFYVRSGWLHKYVAVRMAGQALPAW